MGGNIYVKEDFNDTLYCVNEHYELVPQFVFNFGKYVMSKEKRVQPFRGDMSVLDDVLMTSLLVGIPNHLFFELYVRDVSRFSVSFPAKPQRRETDPPPNAISIQTLDGSIPFGIYDIVNQKIRLLDTDTFSRKSGLINDLDGGFSFWPRYCSSDNELIGVRYAHEMKETLTEEYFATREIKDPQAHQKLRELLNKLQEDDNPVIVIAKLKD